MAQAATSVSGTEEEFVTSRITEVKLFLCSKLFINAKQLISSSEYTTVSIDQPCVCGPGVAIVTYVFLWCRLWADINF